MDKHTAIGDHRDQADAMILAELRTRIADGVASLRTGQVTDGEAFMAMMDAELAEQQTS